jgi:hypothetical protein
VLIGNSEGYWAPSQYILYVDESAEAAVARNMANFLQKVYGVDSQVSRRVTIKNASSRHTRHFEIPGILNYNIESAFPITLSETVRDHLYGWLFKPEQWRTRSVSYRVPGAQVLEYKRTNSLIAEFHLTSENLQGSQGRPGIFFIPPRQEWSAPSSQRVHPPVWAACGSTQLFKAANQ